MLDYILEITFVFLSHFFAVYCTLYSSNEGLCIFIRVMHFKHLKKRSSSKFDTTRLKLRGFRLCADSHNADSDDSVLTHTEQIQTTLCWLTQSRFRLRADSHSTDSDSVLTHTAQIQPLCWRTERRFWLCADSHSADLTLRWIPQRIFRLCADSHSAEFWSIQFLCSMPCLDLKKQYLPQTWS